MSPCAATRPMSSSCDALEQEQTKLYYMSLASKCASLRSTNGSVSCVYVLVMLNGPVLHREGLDGVCST